MTHLDVIVETDLSSLRFELDGQILGVVDHPRLLWECSCYPETGGRSPELGPCRLHSLAEAETVSALFGSSTAIWYRGIPTLWDSYASWPPSVDAWFLVKTLLENKWPPESIDGLWDIGAGTGFLGLQLAAARPQVTRLAAVEISPAAADLCAYNLGQALAERVEVQVLALDARELESSLIEQSDAMVSAPPYIPIPPKAQLDLMGDQGPAFGLDLLEAVIHLAGSTQSSLALLYSSVAEKQVFDIINALELDLRVLDSRLVPFRIGLPSSYIDWLLAGGGLLERKDNVFAFWHWIQVALVSSVS